MQVPCRPFYAGDAAFTLRISFHCDRVRSIWLDSSPRHKGTRQRNPKAWCHVYPSSEHDSRPFGNWELDSSYEKAETTPTSSPRAILHFNILEDGLIPDRSFCLGHSPFLKRSFVIERATSNNNHGDRIRQLKDTLELRITLRFWTLST
jgi:hypothetical protein